MEPDPICFKKISIFALNECEMTIFFPRFAALNEALNGEVQRLKLAIGESSQNESERSKMQSLNAEMFQQLNISQLRQQPQQMQQQSHQQNHQNGTMATKSESNE
jgi:hypothetical protein